jgi:RNA polymerase sigma factor (TIGR02999 family)
MASGDITELVLRWGQGDPAAANRLFQLVYEELRRMAGGYFRGEAPGHTLQPTAVVHELFLKLSGKDLRVQDRQHFYAVAARQMRRLLIEHARSANAGKRGGHLLRVHPPDLEGQRGLPSDVLELDEALTALEKLDARIARVVELRYFAGLTEKEAAELLNISVATLKRDWQFARAWLRSRLD